MDTETPDSVIWTPAQQARKSLGEGVGVDQPGHASNPAPSPQEIQDRGAVPVAPGSPGSCGSPVPPGPVPAGIHTPLPADDIPFGKATDDVRLMLKRTAPQTANVVFDQINRLKGIAYQAHTLGDLKTTIEASAKAGGLALKTLELTVGKQVNVSGTIRSQADIPAWDKIPLEVRQRYQEALDKADAIDVEVLPGMTDEDYAQSTLTARDEA